MADTPASGETEVAPSNGMAAPVTPIVDNGGGSDADKYKQQLQEQMRANQVAKEELEKLRKEKEDREKADTSRKAKELEEKEEFKTLYEQSQAKLEEIEREREAEEQRKAVTETRQNILSDYSDEVKDAAKDLGLSLDEVTEEAVTEFKAKLDKLQTRLGSQRVTPNNPSTPTGKQEYTGEELRQILADPQKRDAYYRAKKDGITASMMDAPRA